MIDRWTDDIQMDTSSSQQTPRIVAKEGQRRMLNFPGWGVGRCWDSAQRNLPVLSKANVAGFPEYDKDEWGGPTLAEASILSFESPVMWPQDFQHCGYISSGNQRRTLCSMGCSCSPFIFSFPYLFVFLLNLVRGWWITINIILKSQKCLLFSWSFSINKQKLTVYWEES